MPITFDSNESSSPNTAFDKSTEPGTTAATGTSSSIQHSATQPKRRPGSAGAGVTHPKHESGTDGSSSSTASPLKDLRAAHHGQADSQTSRNPLALCVACLKLWVYRYEVTTGLYMLEPWEKSIFNSIVLIFIAFSCYTAYVYLPSYLHNLAAKVTEYTSI
ncbi:hypothetical protein IWQ62_000680 [Dispira parvispora]|uniref:Serine palmitoyltransferase small subunit B n=1 Tax=Dispira parvispora TaxID=1520584 RepID=A0A9W8AZN8_9FUNG|nr:hypothetical protein IWQ62_000680 [Dispira parvispora]